MTHSLKEAFVLFQKNNPSSKITFREYRNIIFDSYQSFLDNILFKGLKLQLGSNLSFIQIVMMKRDFSKLVINWPETRKIAKVDGKYPYKVYHTEPYFPKWYWNKSKAKVRNKTPYRFDVLRGEKGVTKKLLSLLAKDDLAYQNFEIRKSFKK